MSTSRFSSSKHSTKSSISRDNASDVISQTGDIAVDPAVAFLDDTSPLLQRFKVKDTKQLQELLPLHLIARLDHADDKGYVSFNLMENTYKSNRMNQEMVFLFTSPMFNEIRIERVQHKLRLDVFENEFYVVHKQDGFYRARVLRKMDHGYHMKLLDFDLDLMATEEDLWPLKFDPETNVGYTLAKQLANLGPYDFISGDYKYGFTVPAYTMIKAATHSIGLVHPTEMADGTIIDVMILSVAQRCLVIVAPKISGHPSFSAHRLVNAFPKESADHWIKMFEDEVSTEKFTQQLPQLKTNFGYGWNFGLIAGVKALDEIYVRDMASSIRVYLIQKILQRIFASEETRSKLCMDQASEVYINRPCVFYDVTSKQYYRAQIKSICGDHVDVMAIDYPLKKLVGVNIAKKVIFYLPGGLQFPPQTHCIKLVPECTDMQDLRCSQLLQVLLHPNMPVTFAAADCKFVMKMRLLNRMSVLELVGYNRTSINPNNVWGKDVPGTSNKFRSSFGTMKAMSVMKELNKQGELKKNKPNESKMTRSASSIFQSSLTPKNPDRKEKPSVAPKDSEPCSYVYAESYDKVFYRTTDMQKGYDEMVNVFTTITPTTLSSRPEVGQYFMLRSGTYGPVRVKVVEDNDQGDFIRYFCIDLGKTDRIPCVDFLRCGSLFKDTLEDFCPKNVLPIIAGPFKLIGDVIPGRESRHGDLKYKSALRQTLRELIDIHIKTTPEGVEVYGQNGECVNNIYYNAINLRE